MMIAWRSIWAGFFFSTISIQHRRWKFEPRSDDFLIRFSLALDFAPYLPGRTRVEAQSLSVLTPGSAYFEGLEVC